MRHWPPLHFPSCCMDAYARSTSFKFCRTEAIIQEGLLDNKEINDILPYFVASDMALFKPMLYLYCLPGVSHLTFFNDDI